MGGYSREPSEPVISKASLDTLSDTARWRQYRKTVPVRAFRMPGPFYVDTCEGTLHCKDGYLCIDARGYPYPVARDEFDLIYTPISDG